MEQKNDFLGTFVSLVLTIALLLFHRPLLLAFGAQIACQMTFNALGNAKASIMVAVMRKFILLLPLIYLMPYVVVDQAMGVYLAEPVADVIAVLFTVILFSFQFRKAMKRLENKE